MTRMVAMVPGLGFEWWKSQSRTKVMTPASPISAARRNLAEPEEIKPLALGALAHQNHD